MTSLGPDVWNNFPEHSAPTSDLDAALASMRATVAGWSSQIFSNAGTWQPRIDALLNQIDTTTALLPPDDIFARPAGASAYDATTEAYQLLKNDLTASLDTIEGGQQSIAQDWWNRDVKPLVVDPILEWLKPVLAKLGIGLEAAGIGIAILLGAFVLFQLRKAFT